MNRKREKRKNVLFRPLEDFSLALETKKDVKVFRCVFSDTVAWKSLIFYSRFLVFRPRFFGEREARRQRDATKQNCAVKCS